MKEKFSFIEVIKLNIRALNVIRELGKSILVIVLKAVTSSLEDYWSVWFMALLVNDISLRLGKERIVRDLLLFVGGNLILDIANEIFNSFQSYQGSDVWDRISVHLNRKVLSLDYEYMESEHVQNQRRNIDQIANTSGGGLNVVYWRIYTFVHNTLSIGIATVCMVKIILDSSKLFPENPVKSMLYSVGFIVLLILLILAGMRHVSHIQRKLFREHDKMVPVMRDMSYYIFHYLEKESTGKEIRLFHQQPLLMKYMDVLYGKVKENLDKIVNLDEQKYGFRGILQNAVLCIIYFYLGILALRGNIPVGTVFLYAGSIRVFTGCFGAWVSEMTRLAANTKYLKIFFDFLDIPNRKYDGTLPVEKRTDDQFELEFRHVSFRYPGSEEYVLKDFSIHFRIGERLAVVGKNGSGKTTFIKLLCRLYDPTEGEILLNGINIRKYDYQEYLSLFSVVFQDFKLLALPLGQNIAAAPEYDEERVRRSLIRAGLSGILDKLGHGLDTALYTDFDAEGIDISGGEAQKIAIARALYHDTPFVILDEPTAALDPLAEYDVYSHFDDLVGTKTAVYISHRLSSCQFCNDIIVIDEGRVLQRGNHKELIQDESGLYYQMWNAQAQYYQQG